MYLSKSKYCNAMQCKKMLWLYENKPEVASEVSNSSVMDNGNMVHEVARNLLGSHITIEYNSDLNKMIEQTNNCLKKDNVVIAEASFKYKNNFCSVDLLKKTNNEYEIYEVKSSTKLKDVFITDISYQLYVLMNLGYKITRCYVVILNNEYVKNGDLELNKLFSIIDCTNDAYNRQEDIEKNIKEIDKYMKKKDVSKDDIHDNCFKPYDCPFFKYCTKNLPTPNVFDIGWRTYFSKKLELYYAGKISYGDLCNLEELNEKARNQVNFELNGLPPKINKNKIKKLLDSFTYPLYFLDFESFQGAIPTIDGTRPYQQICFQYSLHYYLEENGKLYHKEFLSNDYYSNPMYGLCKALCKDIPKDSCVLVYNDSFEISRLREMAAMFPEFKDHLLNIADNIIDLLPIFRNHLYYSKEMGGSASIKVVLPALFPNDPKLDYHNLEQVHKGDEASNAYLSLKDLSKMEEERLRKNMLKYCELDTYAMVKIYEKLKEIIELKST